MLHFRLIHGRGETETCNCGFPLPKSLMNEPICANLVHVYSAKKQKILSPIGLWLLACTFQGVGWASSKLEETSPGSNEWRAHMEPPPNGKWTAFFVDLMYESDQPRVRPRAISRNLFSNLFLNDVMFFE